MPGYLVELLENEKMTLTDQKVGVQVVWAGSVAQARAIAKLHAEAIPAQLGTMLP